jgi:hypothetical protein
MCPERAFNTKTHKFFNAKTPGRNDSKEKPELKTESFYDWHMPVLPFLATWRYSF